MGDHSPAPDRIVELVETGSDEARPALERLADAPAAERNETLRTLRALADERASPLSELLPAVAPFLTDDERSVRLATAKLFVAVAETDPEAAVPTVQPLADRLADDDEFYYVRARSAEALGYVALERPDAVASPDLLADLRVGLAFDEPEVREKLAKALEFVALGDPERLRHQVPRLAERLDDENDLVRYHLSTALVAVGCADPDRLADAAAELDSRLDDSNSFVRGRAAEALGLLGAADADAPVPTGRIAELTDDEAAFAADRARFAASVRDDGGTGGDPDEAGIGSLDGVREATATAIEELTAPDAEGECPHCGLELPESGSPMCPRCGAPR
ncbi:HEAT repeat domain-containing protein [Halosimplex aquaticum]|uniref:HEAT repeat domain-containing protein n=1 Tax=Halosimplex aquaticum TaxID=3026162 RepID=A0ABD5XX30_9EURY|nr:HEAT repeat domain-containing protein [Halosimplex aquaticum]